MKITTPTITAASAQHKDKNMLSTSDSTEELIESLSQITSRRRRRRRRNELEDFTESGS